MPGHAFGSASPQTYVWRAFSPGGQDFEILLGGLFVLNTGLGP
jgi:hypothetical protein